MCAISVSQLNAQKVRIRKWVKEMASSQVKGQKVRQADSGLASLLTPVQGSLDE